MSQLVLSLFPGIGLLDRAFEEHGYCVVRGPDLLWGGDVHAFHPPRDRFDGVIGGPPCQAFSSLANLARARGKRVAANLIPEFERCIAEARPRWILMENVPRAPAPVVDGYAVESFLLNNRWCGGAQHRSRRISFGVLHSAPVRLHEHVATDALEPFAHVPTVLTKGQVLTYRVRDHKTGKLRSLITRKGASAALVRDACEAQGLPRDFLDAAPFTVEGRMRCIGNGVPLPMGRALAAAVARVTAPASLSAAG